MTAPGPTGRSGRRRRGGRIFGHLLLVVAVAAIAVGVIAYQRGTRAQDRAVQARDRRVELVREQRRVEQQTDDTNHGADVPIGDAEQVATSLSKIGGASGTVLEQAASVDDALGRAVDLANQANIAGARQIYRGEAAEAVRRLQEVLTNARLFLAGAQDAAQALQASAQ